LLLNFLLYAVCLLVAWLIPKYLYHPIKVRFTAARVALVAFVSAAFLIFLANIPTLEAFGAVDMRYDQYQNYQYNGFVLSTLMNLADSRVEKPLNYGSATINALAEEIDGMEDPVALGKPQKQPHIIAIQMEAYGNPGLIDSRISYVNDPFAPLAPYSGEIQRFHTLTSVLGGGTANTEYEFLTGFNMVFCPAGVTPFIRYMNQPKPSLVKDLAAMGYQAVALHPHNASFYNRAAAFPRLGFTRFVTMEEFDDPVYIGYYISDGSFGTKVVELYEEERDKGPLFLFAISIQNHGPYSFPETYRAYPVCLSGGLAMDENQIMELETYGANIHDSSVMLANLIGYFSQTDEPVLLLVFGDHQASWSWSLNLPPNPELDLRRYSTESFFWANYPLEVDERTLVSASGLGPLMMRKAGLSLPRYEKGIHLQFDAMMAYNIAITVENDGSARYIDRDMMEAYRLLQYDRMFGADYLDRSRD
jgi:phosphoglycerol transferase MdoB-like AlkP superfamily enzyme